MKSITKLRSFICDFKNTMNKTQITSKSQFKIKNDKSINIKENFAMQYLEGKKQEIENRINKHY